MYGFDNYTLKAGTTGLKAGTTMRHVIFGWLCLFPVGAAGPKISWLVSAGKSTEPPPPSGGNASGASGTVAAAVLGN